MIVGLGLDIVHIPRVSGVMSRHGDRFLRRAFHPKEIEQYHSRGQRPEFLASRYLHLVLTSRWAVKEALHKALGGKERLPFTEVWTCPDQWGSNDLVRVIFLGRPQLVAEGRAWEVMELMGVHRSLVAISHEREYAVASVVLEGKP